MPVCGITAVTVTAALAQQRPRASSAPAVGRGGRSNLRWWTLNWDAAFTEWAVQLNLPGPFLHNLSLGVKCGRSLRTSFLHELGAIFRAFCPRTKDKIWKSWGKKNWRDCTEWFVWLHPWMWVWLLSDLQHPTHIISISGTMNKQTCEDVNYSTSVVAAIPVHGPLGQSCFSQHFSK